MSELRWILLAAAIIVVAYVYWRGRKDQRRGERRGDARIEPVVRAADLTLDPHVAGRREPQLGRIDEVVDEDARVIEPAAAWPADAPTRRVSPARSERADGRRSEDKSAATSAHAGGDETASDPAARKIVALRIARRDGERIPGTLLLDVLHREGLQFGDYRIFHRYAEPAGDRARVPLFSVANMAEPGDLDPDRIEDLDVAGVAMFMVLPGPKAGASALSEMLGTARRVAAGLNAELLDEKGSTMTRQTADHMRDEIVEFEHRRRTEHKAGVPADR
jgi:cell division protein ZipA